MPKDNTNQGVQRSKGKKVVKNIVGRARKAGNKPSIMGKLGRHNWEDLVVPEVVARWLKEDDAKILSNLTRGLKVSDKQTQRARKSLHTARKIVIKKMMAYAYTDAEICLELEINGKELQNYKRALFKDEIRALKESSAEDQFVQYRHAQMEVVKDIDMLIERFKETNSINALSNALKTKAEILKDISNKAQDMGFMERKASEVKVINEIDLSSLSNQEMFDLTQRMTKLVNHVSEGKITNVTNIKRAMSLKQGGKK